MQNTAQQKRSVRDSIERIDGYLQDKGFVVITQIAHDLNLQFGSVKKCVETLQRLERVDVATNGNISLVKAKEKQNAEQ